MVPRAGAVTFFLVMVLAALTLATSIALVTGTMAGREACAALQEGGQFDWTLRSGIQWALWRVYGDANWRTTLPVGPDDAWLTAPMSVGGTTFMVYGFDPVDGDFADDPTDPVALRVQAALGETTAECTATLEPYPHPALAYAVFSSENHILFKNGPVLQAPVRGNAALDDDGKTVVDVSAGGRLETVQGASVKGNLLPYTTFVPQAMPEVKPDFGWYAARATVLPDTSISRASLTETALIIDGNRFAPNPNGIYLIDGGYDSVSLKDVYLRGTLLIRHAEGVSITGGFRCDIGPLGGPTLLARTMARTMVKIDISVGQLDEAADQVDYNGDGDRRDVIPCQLTGMLWTNRKLQLQPSVPIVSEGLLVGKHIHIYGPVELRKFPGQESWRQPGMLGPGLRLRPGSVRRIR